MDTIFDRIYLDPVFFLNACIAPLVELTPLVCMQEFIIGVLFKIFIETGPDAARVFVFESVYGQFS